MYEAAPAAHDHDALYGRVSSDEQADRGTINTQTDFYRRWKELHGGASVGEFLDEGVSGVVPLEQREGGARLLAMARAGKIKRVVFYRLDRLGRDIRVILSAVDQLEAAGVVVLSMTEPFDTSTPVGRFVLGLLALFAGFERDSIKERAQDGQRRKARAGGWLGGLTAYGYRVEGQRERATLALDHAIVPEFGATTTRVDVAKWIFEEVADRGQSCIAVAAHLNTIGVPAPRGQRWYGTAIARMLHNPVYRGSHRYGDEKGSVLTLAEVDAPAIVDADLWERAQVRIAQNMRLSNRTGARDYLLRGLITCRHCGSSYTGATMPGMADRADETDNREGVIYRCNGKINGKGCPGDGKNISGEVETLVWNAVRQRLQNPGDVLSEVEAALPPINTEEQELGRIEAALARIADERNTVTTLRRRQRIDDATYDRQMDDLEAEENVLSIERTRLAQSTHLQMTMRQMAETAVIAMRDFAARCSADVDNLDRAGKRYYIESLVEKVIVETVPVTTPPVKKSRWPKTREVKVYVQFRLFVGMSNNGLTQGEGQVNLLHQAVSGWRLPEWEIAMKKAGVTLDGGEIGDGKK